MSAGALTPDLVAWMALRRVHGGGLVRLASGRYLDTGRAIPGHIKDALTELTAAGLIDEHDDPGGSGRRLRLTAAGAARFGELAARRQPWLPVPPPEFPRTPAGRRSMAPPGGQPDPSTRTRWARCPHDGRLHAVDRLDIDLVPVRGYTEALCGHRLPPDAAAEDGPSGALCLPCVVGITSDTEPGRFGGWAI